MKVLTDAMGVPIFNWAEDLEEGALNQAHHLAQLPFAHHHIAIMPDGHLGMGMPIGGVLAAKNVIVPNAVGVDIGCGVLSTKTSLKREELNRDNLTKIFTLLRELIPVGFNHHSREQDEKWMPEAGNYFIRDKMTVVGLEYERALKQVGTLGGGNHFIEIQYEEEDEHIWFTVHSGSRNLGKKVADHYDKIAIGLNARWFSGIPVDWDLAFLPYDAPAAQAYLTEMAYCVDFAYCNRRLMENRIFQALSHVFPRELTTFSINIPHNYVAPETHYDEEVWVHRKGATRAALGQLGVIPGSQGSPTFIVKGKGSRKSFQSCSHGAGRKLSRTAAKRTLNLAEELHKMEKAGVLLHGMRGSNDLDEAAGSYKDIHRVMELQDDLVEIVHTLRPIAVMKG